SPHRYPSSVREAEGALRGYGPFSDCTEAVSFCPPARDTMVANLCLLTCALFMAQATDRTGWQFVPRLGRGQELVYRGSYAEESVGKGIHFSRSYRLENRIFVLEVHPRSLEIALQTVLKLRTPRSEHGDEPEPS